VDDYLDEDNEIAEADLTGEATENSGEADEEQKGDLFDFNRDVSALDDLWDDE
jgi:hypothetical protein